MAFPYKLYGGALRPDAISGLNPQFASALQALYAAAPPEVQAELGLNSAYRSAAIQQQLWDKSDKTGRTVAAPGKSRHQFGEAADLYGFGLTKDAVSQPTKDWVLANAEKHGLYFPMSYEPWHIQLARAEGQSGPGPKGVTLDTAPAVATTTEAPPTTLKESITRDLKKEEGGVLSGLAESMANKRAADEAAYADFSQIPTGGDVGNPNVNFASAQSMMSQLLQRRRKTPGLSLMGMG